MAAGQGADAEVHGAAAEVAADPAVLGHAPFGDVQVGHDLEAGGHRRDQRLRQGFDIAQHAVLTEADQQAVLLGLDVDVAGEAGEGFDQDPIHQAHHR